MSDGDSLVAGGLEVRIIMKKFTILVWLDYFDKIRFCCNVKKISNYEKYIALSETQEKKASVPIVPLLAI
jgi:hypothetical protein